MRIFLVNLTPSPDVQEPIIFDRNNCLWLDANNLGTICDGLGEQYKGWLLKFGAKVTEYQVRAVDMHGRSTYCKDYKVIRSGGEK